MQRILDPTTPLRYVLIENEILREAVVFYSKREHWMQIGEGGPYKIIIANGNTDSADGFAVAETALATVAKL